MRWWGVFGVTFALAGCRERRADIQRAPERELPRTVPAPVDSAVVQSLIGHLGEEVTIAGVHDPAARPRIPWTVPGKSPMLIDVNGSHLRVVAHVDDAPPCDGELVLTGNVIVARGMFRQGTTEGPYVELQLDVTKSRCR